jgi:hypothetical protein
VSEASKERTLERSQFEATLTEEQIAEMATSLKGLVEHPGFEVLCELLKGSRVLAREQALDGPLEDINFWKGYIEGLKVAEGIPQSVLARMDDIAIREEKLSEKKSLPLSGGYGTTTF